MNRNVVIAGAIVLLHVAALWALQAGLLQRAVEMVVPVEMLSQLIDPPMPKAAPPPPVPVRQPAPKIPAKSAPPQPLALTPPAPATDTATPTPAAPEPPAPLTAPAAAPTPVAPPAAPKTELPSSRADYLHNPPLSYPPMSMRLSEQGKVIVRVLIGADGQPQNAELKKSSGYDRLDRAALDYVMKCRYVPGKVGGVAQAMWYEAPVNFVLE